MATMIVQCPVCSGRGFVPAGFYIGVTETISTGGASHETCRACGGNGVIRDSRCVACKDTRRLYFPQLGKELECPLCKVAADTPPRDTDLEKWLGRAQTAWLEAIVGSIYARHAESSRWAYQWEADIRAELKRRKERGNG